MHGVNGTLCTHGDGRARIVAPMEEKRGKLTIFFGAAPGVGKTYTMLEAAREELTEQKRDVVVGIVETQGRYDTGALLMGLTILPRRTTLDAGAELSELDLAGALTRRPSLILVDDLAHTNAPGSRHTKRWQDVEELLAAGIDVFTTLNVQHLMSLNDVVREITHVTVEETVPDSVFDTAYEVRVVDLPVDELLDRLHEGKVYLPEQAERAREQFFREGNLIALRELSLRRTAERVEAKMRGYKAAHGIEETWHTGERVLVCVSPSPHAATLVRAARRMATSLHAELVAVYVETHASIRLSTKDRERLAAHMRLVESLGGEAVTLRAEDPATETVRYARKRNATKIVVGKPRHSRIRDLIRASFLDDLVRKSREIDVYVISGVPTEPERRADEKEQHRDRAGTSGYAAGVLVVCVAGAFSWLVFGRGELTDVVMVFLLGVTLVSMRFGYGPSLVATVLSVLAFDFFFVPPYFSFAVTDLHHILTFGVMFLVAFVVSNLTKRIRDQVDSARQRERRTASLYALSRELGPLSTEADLLSVAARHIRDAFTAKVAVLIPQESGGLRVALADPGTMDERERDMSVCDWVSENKKPAGAGTDTLPSARPLCLPLKWDRGPAGVFALYASEPAGMRSPEELQLLGTLMGLLAAALERVVLAEETRQARLRAETEQMRNALLSSVSHDLRTPLAVVTGATSTLLFTPPKDESVRRELLETAHEEAQRLNRLVRNLLDMTRLEAGALKVQKSMEPVEEVVGSALERLSSRLTEREVNTNIPAELPLAPFDSVLVEQTLINLLENALKYSPDDTPIAISARANEAEITVSVEDRGPGIATEQRERIFDKFYRVREGEGGGAGLGLTICRGIITAHGGRIWVEDREGGGAAFRFTLPLGDAEPRSQSRPQPEERAP